MKDLPRDGSGASEPEAPLSTSPRPMPRPAKQGQSLVEFALVVVVFLMFVLAISDLGLGIISYNMLAEAARAGARAGLVNQTRAAVDTAAYAEVSPSLNNLQVTNVVFCTSNSSSCTPSDTAPYVLVTVQATYEPLTGSLLGLPSSVILSATCKRYLPQ